MLRCTSNPSYNPNVIYAISAQHRAMQFLFIYVTFESLKALISYRHDDYNGDNIYGMLNHNIEGVSQNCVTIGVLQFIGDKEK